MYDLDRREALNASKRMRMNAQRKREEEEMFEEVVGIVGGRLSYLGKACKAKEMIDTAKHMLQVEKAWLLSQIGLIQDCDDDVMDEVRYQLNPTMGALQETVLVF